MSKTNPIRVLGVGIKSEDGQLAAISNNSENGSLCVESKTYLAAGSVLLIGEKYFMLADKVEIFEPIINFK